MREKRQVQPGGDRQTAVNILSSGTASSGVSTWGRSITWSDKKGTKQWRLAWGSRGSQPQRRVRQGVGGRDEAWKGDREGVLGAVKDLRSLAITRRKQRAGVFQEAGVAS